MFTAGRSSCNTSIHKDYCFSNNYIKSYLLPIASSSANSNVSSNVNLNINLNTNSNINLNSNLDVSICYGPSTVM